MTTTDQLARAAEALSEATTIALACHVNPDADALGSMLGLSNHLRGLAKQTVCSFPNDPFEPPRWASMLPGTERWSAVRVPEGPGRDGHVRCRVARPAGVAGAPPCGRRR